ncbi:hypothetical protein [Streptomyces parvulus]|uniref:Uncharacterized protein n=1 Tax=Streptomyces parvulus TaxID=146923 RepID=A0A369UV86_9ACTN|nr:hypothetical protein [Streptomyces parvulus]RDD84664.1 hypothetical protein DVZ84_34100 [Streptomyces parvulus]
MFVSLFLLMVLGFELLGGGLAYAFWKHRRHPWLHRRWWVLGTTACALGYAHTLAYGLALTQPTDLCGQRTLDNDYPLTHVRADAFPPRLACYWSDWALHGPSHPTAAGTWLMWCGAALLVAGAAAWAVSLDSPVPRWARAGMILAPATFAALWIRQVAPLMSLPPLDLQNECFRWQVAHLHSAPSGELATTKRTLMPPAVECVFTDGTANLISSEAFGLACCLAVFLHCCATPLLRMSTAAAGVPRARPYR